MPKTTTATVEKTTVDFSFEPSEFGGEIQEQQQGLPYCQVQNQSMDNPVFGLFIPAEQAERAGFTTSNDWKAIDLTFGSETVPGYLAQTVRCHVLLQTPKQVEQWNDRYNNYVNLGLAYNNGDRKLAELAKNSPKIQVGDVEKPEYVEFSHVYLLFVDEQGSPLHSVPFALKMRTKAAFSVSFMSEFLSVLEATDNLLKDAGQLPKNASYFYKDRYNLTSASSLVRFDFELESYRRGKLMPYCRIKAVRHPAMAEIGSSFEIDRSWKDDKKAVTATRVSFNDLVVKGKSDTGIVISEMREQYKEIAEAKSNKNKVAPFPATTGLFNFESLDYTSDGFVSGMFQASTGKEYRFLVDPDMFNAVKEDVQMVITGKMKGSILHIETVTEDLVNESVEELIEFNPEDF